jgi:3D (Asp-Asp-Asp) domain-containing protein
VNDKGPIILLITLLAGFALFMYGVMQMPLLPAVVPHSPAPICTVQKVDLTPLENRLSTVEAQLKAHGDLLCGQSIENDALPKEFIATAYTRTGDPTSLGVKPALGTLAVRNPALLLKVFQLEGAPDGIPSRLVSTDLMPEISYGLPVPMNGIDIFLTSQDQAKKFGRHTVRVAGTRKTRLCEVIMLEFKE